jgi:hypothetical protein
VWRKPCWATAKTGLEHHRGGEMREDADLDLILDVLYGPLYYRLLFGHRCLSEKYTNALADLIVDAIAKR